MKGLSTIRYAVKGQSTLEISIPREMIKVLKLKSGDQLEWEENHDYAIVRKVSTYPKS